MPARQGEIGTQLLSPFEDGHYSNRGTSKNHRPYFLANSDVSDINISYGLGCLLVTKSCFFCWLGEDVCTTH